MCPFSTPILFSRPHPHALHSYTIPFFYSTNHQPPTTNHQPTNPTNLINPIKEIFLHYVACRFFTTSDPVEREIILIVVDFFVTGEIILVVVDFLETGEFFADGEIVELKSKKISGMNQNLRTNKKFRNEPKSPDEQNGTPQCRFLCAPISHTHFIFRAHTRTRFTPTPSHSSTPPIPPTTNRQPPTHQPPTTNPPTTSPPTPQIQPSPKPPPLLPILKRTLLHHIACRFITTSHAVEREIILMVVDFWAKEWEMEEGVGERGRGGFPSGS